MGGIGSLCQPGVNPMPPCVCDMCSGVGCPCLWTHRSPNPAPRPVDSSTIQKKRNLKKPEVAPPFYINLLPYMRLCRLLSGPLFSLHWMPRAR